MHGDGRRLAENAWSRQLQMYALCASALMFGVLAAGCQTGPGGGGGQATRLARVTLRADAASTYRPALSLPRRATPRAADEAGRHQSALIAPEPVNVRVTISAPDFGELSQTVPAGATSLEFLVPQGPARLIVLVYLDAGNAILGSGSAVVDVGADVLVVPIVVAAGVPGIAVLQTDTPLERNAIQNRPFAVRSFISNNSNAAADIQNAGHRFRTLGSLSDMSGSFTETPLTPARPFTVSPGTIVDYTNSVVAATAASPGLFQLDAIVQGTTPVQGAFGIRTSVLSATVRLIKEHVSDTITGGLNAPVGLERGPAGELLITDTGAHRIVLFDGTGVTRVAGSAIGVAGNEADGLALNTNINGPRGITLVGTNPDRYVYCETPNHRVRELTLFTDGRGALLKTITGSTTGTAGSGPDGGPALSAFVNAPEDAIAIGDAVFIADTGNHVVRKIDANGIITRIAGNFTATDGGDGPDATLAGINLPHALAVDLQGNLLIAHELVAGTEGARGLIRRVNLATGAISTVAGSRGAGISDNFPDGGEAVKTPIGQVLGLVVDAEGFIYCSEQLNNFERIRVVDPEGNLREVAGGAVTPGPGEVGRPATNFPVVLPGHLVIDSGAVLYAHTGKARVDRLR